MASHSTIAQSNRDRCKRGGDFCSAVNCSSARNKASCKEKSFYRFPKDEERCKKWIQLCRRVFPKHLTPSHLHRNYKLCSDHFEDSQFNCPSQRSSLKWNAIPTLFSVPNPPPKVTRKRPTNSWQQQAETPGCNITPASLMKSRALTNNVSSSGCCDVVGGDCQLPAADETGLTQCSAQAQLSGFTAQRKSSLIKSCSVKSQAGLSAMENHVTWVTILMDRKVYTVWRQIKDDRFLSDTDIASFLLNYYDKNREAPSSCTRCRCTLIHVCTSQEENVDKTLKAKHEHEEEVKMEDIEMPDLTPSCEQRSGQNGGVTADNLSAVDTFIKLEPQSDQVTEYVERAVKTQEEILNEIESDDQPGPKNWTTIELSGNMYRKWREVKGQLLLKDHNQLATFLIRIFKEEARPGCVKCASPLWHLCAACFQRSVEGGHGENDNKSTLISLVGHEPVSACSKPEPCLAENTEWEQSSVKQLHNFACRDNETVSMADLENCPKDMEGCEQIDCKKSSGTRELVPKSCLLVENEAQTEGIQLNIKGKRKWKKKYFCKYCLKVFLSLDELRVHRKADHVAERKKKRVNKSVSCLQSFTSKKEKTNHLKEELRRLCDRCGLMMTMSLSVHMRVHTQEKPYECNVCHRTFTQSSSLTKHKQTHTQLENRTHQCSTCSKRFCSRTSLQSHQLVHTKEKPYNCLTCGRAFSGKCNLVRHRLVHTGEKPYMCDICGDRFSQFTNMQSHKKVHSDSSRRQIRKRRGMVKPKRMEKQKLKACLVCGKTFSLPGNLSRHKLLHSNCRQFLCYLCGKSFNSYDNLTAHEKIHL